MVYEGWVGRGSPGRDGHRVCLKETFHLLLEENTGTVPSTVDAAGWLRNHLDGDAGDTDLARAMVQAFAEALMSAEASMQCQAGYGERSEERTNSRNGYRNRRWDTRSTRSI